MRKQSKIEFLVYRGTADPPEVVTVNFLGDISLDSEAIEYWRRSAAKFYGNARVMLVEEDLKHPKKRGKSTFRVTNRALLNKVHHS